MLFAKLENVDFVIVLCLDSGELTKPVVFSKQVYQVAMQSFAVVLGVLLLAAPLISAGDYRGRPHKEAPEDWLSYNPSPSPLLEAGRLPKSFNWCNLPSFPGENMCTTAWNQHIPIYCGSCWAHGTLSMVQDRLKIKKKGKGPDVMLSRQTLLNCAAFKGMGAGCDGVFLFHVLLFSQLLAISFRLSIFTLILGIT